MPSALTYPGVYIEEIPSGVRTITGVATSIAAFLGRARRGPVNEPTTVNSFGDFERTFGGLWANSSMSFAVQGFFRNGGSQALVVRLTKDAAAATIDLPTGAVAPNDKLTLRAANAGAWGSKLKVTVNYQTRDTSNGKLFNLIVVEDGGDIEKHLNVSVDTADPRFVARVLDQSSSLVRAQTVPDTRPTEATTSAANSGTDGNALTDAEFTGSESNKTGLFALEKADLFNLLCVPPYTSTGDVGTGVVTTAAQYCEKRRALLLVDPPSTWTKKQDAVQNVANVGTNSKNAALFFPRLRQPNPLREGQLEDFVPCGAVAGIFARTDATRGVWKAPAGLEAVLVGVPQLSVPLTDAENGELNPLGVNCLRTMPAVGRVVWGARTLQGNDRLASEWKYIPVRRLALFIEESLYRGTQWTVFEPNDEPLWSQIRLNLGAFMQNLFVQGAFQGRAPRESYFVKCDKETTTQNDINLGVVNIVVGFAPLKPAEFVVIKIQQMAGQIQT
jgi:phage tail sheath protein FI